MSWTLDPRYVPANVKWAKKAPTHLGDTIAALQGRPRDVSTLKARPTTLSERFASAIVPDGRKWTDLRNKVSGAVDAVTPLGAEQPLRDARSAYQGGNKWGAAGLSALAALGVVPGPQKGASKAAKGIFGKKGIIAYHGSPHSFDKFSLDKIGTGEGAQAYGHGLYFAENEGVAKAYRDTLAGDGFLTGSGEVFDPSTLQHKNVKVMAGRGDLDGAISRAREIAMENGPVSNLAAKDLRVLQSIKDSGGIRPNPGSMYQVRINANPEDFLDWDARLAEQPAYDKISQYADGIRSTGLEDMYKDFLDASAMHGMEGADFYRIATSGKSGTAAHMASDLKAAGIPGIKYLDAGSRGAGDGSRNYVVFDDALIEILKKYGIAVPAMGLGIAGMSQQPEGGM